MKKIISIIIIGVLILTTNVISVKSNKIPSDSMYPQLEESPEFVFNLNDDSSRVLINLYINGISYGHELLWKANTTGTNYQESAVVYLDDVAFIGSCSTHGEGHDRLFAVDATTGDTQWSIYIGPGYVGPVIDNNRVYIGTSSHGHDPENEYVYCINRTDGTVLWRRNIYGGIPESIQYDDENIYFTSNIIYALDKEDGSIQWTYPMDEFSVTKPILKDNAFYTATSGGTMYKIDVSDGRMIWEVPLSGFSWDNSITADGKGHIFLALYEDRTMNAYDEETGDLLWSYQLHDSSLSFNAYHDNVVFISDTSGYVYALNGSTGALIWEKKIGHTIDISSPSISGGFLVIGTRDFEQGSFFALNETNGDIIWKYTVGASVSAPPSIVNGMMLCGTDDWNMYAFDFGVGSGNWLLSRYDASNTAYSPNGLLSWQFVSASCITENNITRCTVTNTYDHDVTNVKLKLPDGINLDWYDESGNLLQSESNRLIIDHLSSQSSIVIIISSGQNYPPSRPTISGPLSGKTNIEYTYQASSIDFDDEIWYFFDWGDGSDSGWLGPYRSSEECSTMHSWSKRGSYTIRCKAKDSNEAESEWSNPLSISMPKTKPYFNTLFLQFLQNFLKKYPLIYQLLQRLLKL